MFAWPFRVGLYQDSWPWSFYPHSSSACLRLFLGSIQHYVCWRKDPHFVDVFLFVPIFVAYIPNCLFGCILQFLLLIICYYVMLHYIKFYYTIFYCIILHVFKLCQIYDIILDFIISYCVILYHILFYLTILYYITLYYIL